MGTIRSLFVDGTLHYLDSWDLDFYASTDGYKEGKINLMKFLELSFEVS